MKSLVFSVLLAVSTMPAAADSFGNAVPLDTYVGGRVVTHVVPGQVSSTYVGGQVVVRISGGRSSYTYAWPGIYFEAQFTGDTVDVKVDDDQNNLNLYIDGVHKLTLTRPGRATVALKDLGAGRHIVRLEKTSETQNSTGTFDGFYVMSAEQALPAPHYDRSIEFIGDSFTVGYGNTSRGQTCTVDDVRDTTDTSEAFAPLTAKYFGAAYRIHAYSGEGVVRNYSNIRPGITLPELYQYTLFDKSAPVPDDGWTPDIVVIGLGTNDFSTPLADNERWKTHDELRADFIGVYVSFVKSLHEKWPAAHFILMASTSFNEEIIDAVNAVADTLKSDGLTDLEVISFGNLDYQACQGHPSLKDEGILSQMLIDHISRLPKFSSETNH
ncbi:MAG: GDSL-type esterase/lipase family protein [Rhizomicrobium sp.]